MRSRIEGAARAVVAMARKVKGVMKCMFVVWEVGWGCDCGFEIR